MAPNYKNRLSDPGKRSTIPDNVLKQLSPHLYSVRLHNRKVASDNNTLYNPTAVLSGKALHDLVSKLAGLELDPQISATKQELGLAKANDTALTDRIQGYNKGTQDYMAGVVDKNATAQGSLTTALANNTNSTLSALKADNAGDQQLEGADAQLRGTGLGGGMDSRLAGDYARQVAGTQANLGAQTNQSLVQAGGWTGLATIMAGASAMRGNDALNQAAVGGANREAGLTNKISALKASRGATEAKYLIQARKDEFEKAAAEQTLGIKGVSAQASLLNAKTNANKPPPETTYQKEVSKWSAKLGLTPHAFMKLNPTQRAARIKAYNNAGKGQGGKTIDEINREGLAREAANHGYTLEEWNNLTPSQRQKIAAGKTAGKAKQPNGMLAPTGQSTGVAAAERIAGNPHALADKAKGVTYNQARVKMIADPAFKKVAPAIINAALDKIYVGYITEGTRRRLRAEGYNPKRIAKALGIRIGGAGANLGNVLSNTLP